MNIILSVNSLVSHQIWTVNFWLLHWAATYCISGNIPLEFYKLAVDSDTVCVFRWTFEPSQSLFPCIVRLGVFDNLTRTQYRIRKDVDLCALKINNSFITDQWQIFPWMIFPTNCFQSRDFILLRHQSCRNVEHLFKCEICCVRDGMTIVQVILFHEYCWFPCYNHEHSPNHRMFLSIFCNIWNSFLSFPHLIIHPIHEWSWFHLQFLFCFIVSNDKLLWLCFSLRINIGSPDLSRGVTSFTTDCAVPSCWVSSWEKPGWDSRVVPQEVTSGLPDRSHISVSVFHSWEDQAWSSSHFE